MLGRNNDTRYIEWLCGVRLFHVVSDTDKPEFLNGPSLARIIFVSLL